MRRWLPFLTFLVFIAAVIYAADRQLARGFFGWVQSVPLGDKAGHFVLMGGLAFGFCRNRADRLVRALWRQRKAAQTAQGNLRRMKLKP